jgi:hypothetical protein
VIGVRLDPDRQVASGSHAWAETVLRDQGMPPDELRDVSTTADRELVRRHLELHLERLEERLGHAAAKGGGDRTDPRRSVRAATVTAAHRRLLFP